MKQEIPYLSPTEFAFMKIIWNAERPLSVAEILDRRVDDSWARNSVHPLINSLLEKGFIGIKGIVKASKANSRLYAPEISLAEYTAFQITRVFEKDKEKFSMAAFFSGLLGEDEAVDDAVVKEVADWLKGHTKGKKGK